MWIFLTFHFKKKKRERHWKTNWAVFREKMYKQTFRQNISKTKKLKVCNRLNNNQNNDS